ncbi:MAG: TrmH family RNA methyltransferase [Chitinophagaceae bacterium]|nr:MAG: TrmH family RNA methyltransferase [Chitinophagaceae bacterium]
MHEFRKKSMEDLQRLENEDFEKSTKMPLILVLDNIRSLNNTGAIFRTADAFRIEKIYLCGITAQPPHREIHKTALGATETVKWEYRKDINELISDLKSNDYKIFALEQADNSLMMDKLNWDGKKAVLVIGNEVEGVQDEIMDLADECLEIPQYGTKHSLNVSVAAGISIWAFYSTAQIGQKIFED